MFGLGVAAPAQPPRTPAPEEDFGDIDVESPASRPAAPARAAAPTVDELMVDLEGEPAVEAKPPPPAPLELPPEEPEAPARELELAPLHAFVPPADQVGHKPEAAAPVPAAARAGDGGEAVLREALSKASLEVIEKVVWEVVPQLAETIIRENLEKLVKHRQE
jgi:hypothetical protein